MSANPIWIAGYFGPVAGASPVWIAPGDGTVPSAVQSEIVSYYAPVAGATAVWIAGFFAPPPAAIGATPITISGWGGSGGGGPPPVTSVWSASDAAANGMTLSNGGLTVTASSSLAKALNTSIRGTISKTSGKLYVEFLYIQAGAGNDLVGLADAGFSSAGALGASIYSEGTGYLTTAVSSGFTTNYSTALYPVNTDVFAVAVDFAAGKIWLAKNNVWLNSSDPAAGSLPIVSFVPATVGALFPAWTGKGASNAVTLQSTAASQKYAPPSGFSAWDSAAPTHSPQALAYLARTVGGNEGGNGANIATLIDGLVSDGVWAKLDALYVLAQQNQTDAQLNLVGTSYPLVSAGLLRASTFANYQGFTIVGASHLDTGLVPPTTNYTLNSASMGAWAYNVQVGATPIIGTGGTSQFYYDYPSTPNLLLAYLNSGQLNATPNSPNATGFYAVDRSASNSSGFFYNGANQGTATTASTALPTAQFQITGPAGQTLSAAFIGASLGAAGQLALYNRLRTYMTAVGVP